MRRVAILLAPGFEEIEAITTIDLLRRAGFTVDIVGLEEMVTGSHGITIQADKVLDNILLGYDLLVIPGGQPGATHLRNNTFVIQSLQLAYIGGKMIGAICAGPLVLEKAGLLRNKNYVSFPGTENELSQGNRIKDATVVVDRNLVTARGAGLAIEFSLALIELLDGDATKIRDDIQYGHVIQNDK